MAQTGIKISNWISEKRCLPYRFRKSIAKKLNPEMLVDYPFEADFMGVRYQGNAGNYIERMIYFCGAYEKYMIYFLRDVIKRMDDDNLVFVDVGANVGNHSLFMSKLVKDVHSFEPYFKVRESFEKNMNLNDIKNINIHPYGVGDENKKIPFYAPTTYSEGNGSFVEGVNDGNELLCELEVVQGDDFFAKNSIDKVDFLKVDVEGFESQVFKGMEKTLEKSRPIVAFELLPMTRKEFGGFGGMKKAFPDGYNFYRFSQASRDGGKYKIAPFDYDAEYKRKDVIAVPKEKEKFVR